jgi:MFS family permease
MGLQRLAPPAFAAAGCFGAFWGAWGASLPKVQDHAGATDGQLGLALLFIGAGALPAMPAMGRTIDRWGLRTGGLALAAMGIAGVGVAASGSSVLRLCIGLAIVGACSGAADVGINALAGRAEAATEEPVIAHAHAIFSTLVVLGALGTGGLYAVDAPLTLTFAAVAGLSLLAAGYVLAAAPAGAARDPARAEQADAPDDDKVKIAPLLLVGALGAIALATENAHQSWSAVFAHHELHAAVGLAAVAPAVFAGTVAITRFGTARAATDARPATVLVIGAGTAAGGTAIVGAAPSLVVAALGLALAAAGTGVLFPTVIRIVSRTVPEAQRGRATSVVSTVSYLGFLVGPVYVGLWADAAGLRAAMFAVSGLAVVLALSAVPLTAAATRLRGSRSRPQWSTRP